MAEERKEGEMLLLHPLRKEVKGFLPPPLRIPMTNLLSTGHTQELIDIWKGRRKKIGLVEVPPTAYRYDEAIKQVQEIVRILKVEEKIGYDYEKKGLKY